MNDQEFKNDLQLRLFKFSVNTIQSVRSLPKGKEYDVISYQVLKSTSSCGANYDEAQGAVSRADFTNKIAIALKEMRESNYWIKLIIATTENNQDWIKLKKESIELMNILGSICAKTSAHREFHSKL
ncbi:MAG: four helix bundle protein [Bacteroidetes bacterium]|nr:four helix bundle protein [Bacteroidota bacterium]